jgi:hypothetical protein
MTTTEPEPRPANWAAPDPKVCSGPGCTVVLAGSDPDYCEKCDEHGRRDFAALMTQIRAELSHFPASGLVSAWATGGAVSFGTRPLGTELEGLLHDVKAVRRVVEDYAQNAEADRVKLAEHEQVAAGLRRAASFFFGEQA